MKISFKDYANIIKSGKPVMLRVPVPSPEEGGMPRLLRQLHYEHGIEKPDYDVYRDWNALEEDSA